MTGLYLSDFKYLIFYDGRKDVVCDSTNALSIKTLIVHVFACASLTR